MPLDAMNSCPIPTALGSPEDGLEYGAVNFQPSRFSEKMSVICEGKLGTSSRHDSGRNPL